MARLEIASVSFNSLIAVGSGDGGGLTNLRAKSVSGLPIWQMAQMHAAQREGEGGGDLYKCKVLAHISGTDDVSAKCNPVEF